MNEAIEMLKKIVKMQKDNYGNGMNTHLALIDLAKEATLVINKNDVLPVVVHCSFCGDESKIEECDVKYFHKKDKGCCKHQEDEIDETHYELITPTDCDPE